MHAGASNAAPRFSQGIVIDADKRQRIHALFQNYDTPTSPGCSLRIMSGRTMAYARGYADPRLLAHVVVSKYCDHLLLYRQEQTWIRTASLLATVAAWVALSRSHGKWP